MRPGGSPSTNGSGRRCAPGVPRPRPSSSWCAQTAAVRRSGAVRTAGAHDETPYGTAHALVLRTTHVRLPEASSSQRRSYTPGLRGHCEGPRGFGRGPGFLMGWNSRSLLRRTASRPERSGGSGGCPHGLSVVVPGSHRQLGWVKPGGPARPDPEHQGAQAAGGRRAPRDRDWLGRSAGCCTLRTEGGPEHAPAHT